MARRVRLTVRGAILIGVVLTLGLLAAAPARQLYEQKRDIAEKETQLAELEKENKELSEHLELLEDPDYQEELARKELGLVKPGEVAYIVVDPPETTATVKAKPVDAAWYSRLWQWVTSLAVAE